ncbi:MAG TPA: glycosyltransferase family 2 protein [Waterburya sp.]|jgi:GT2 family glycosyltransferase
MKITRPTDPNFRLNLQDDCLMMTITVLIPTYCRPQDLLRCLESLKHQTRPADEVLVVVRSSDTATWNALNDFDSSTLPLRTVTVNVPGQVAALNAGLDAAKSDIIAITDDDAAPRPQWLKCMEAHYLADPQVGGVGGRDWTYHGTQLAPGADGELAVVGKLQWFGRLIPHHHLGAGVPREVDTLRGANMSFRRSAIANLRFDERLRGTGAQPLNDVAFSLAVKRAGFKLIYDPEVAVNHYPGVRVEEGSRYDFNETGWLNAVHNETFILLEHFPPVQRTVFFLWATLVGTREARGLVQLLRLLPREGKFSVHKWLASQRGRWQGWQTWQKYRV